MDAKFKNYPASWAVALAPAFGVVSADRCIISVFEGDSRRGSEKDGFSQAEVFANCRGSKMKKIHGLSKAGLFLFALAYASGFVAPDIVKIALSLAGFAAFLGAAAGYLVLGVKAFASQGKKKQYAQGTNESDQDALAQQIQYSAWSSGPVNIDGSPNIVSPYQ